MRKGPEEIFGMFSAAGSCPRFEPIGNGHIHDTWAVSIAEKEGYEYIIQRLNSNVFRNIPGLQENIERVTGHLRQKLSNMAGSDPERECLTLIPAREGRSYITDNNREFWRM